MDGYYMKEQPTLYELAEQTQALVIDIHGSQARKLQTLQARLQTADELLCLAFELLNKSLVLDAAVVSIKSRARVMFDRYRQTCNQSDPL